MAVLSLSMANSRMRSVAGFDHFGLRYAEAEIAAMRATAQFNAKNPGKPFQPDGEAKRRSASEEVRELARGLGPLYAELEALRRAG